MSTLRKVRTALVLCAVACLLTLGAPRASADTFYNLIDPNIPGNNTFVVVDVHLNGTGDATITFTAQSSTLGMIDGGALDLMVNTSLGYSGAFTGLSSGLSARNGCSSFPCASNVNIDNIGYFNLAFDLPNAGSPVQTLSIELTGGGWTDSSQVLTTTGNGNGNFAGSHVQLSTCTVFVGTTTGSAGSGTCGAVPEPASMGLLGTALLGAYGLLRRKLA